MIKEKSCGAVVYKFDKDGKVLILLEKMQKGHISIPKGHVENDETEVQTALREIKEETNLDVLIDTNFRQVISYSPYKDCIKDVVFFVAAAKSEQLKNQECEVASLCWANEKDALEMLTFESDKQVVEKAVKYILNK